MSTQNTHNASQIDEKLEQIQYATWLKQFIDTYQKLSTDNLSLLDTVYHQGIVFIDPMHKVTGLDNLQQYFSKLYRQLNHCTFKIDHVVAQDTEAAIYWQMHYQHPRLNSGKLVHVYGSSYIKGDGEKVIYHRDYIDLGVMLYEQIPLLGRLIRWLKTKAVN